MKKILLTSIAAAGCCVSAFGQGWILFENTLNSSAGITLGVPGNPSTGSGLVVQLFWNNGSSFVLEDIFTSTFTGVGNAQQNPGHFYAGQLTIPQSGTQTFEVDAFYTSGGDAYTGATGAFTSTVTVSPNPPQGTEYGGWDGNLVLEAVPEPATIALVGLGAAALLLFRRRTRSNSINQSTKTEPPAI